MIEEIPRPGQKYKHFKGNLYQIIAVATHSETGEQLVVYQALYGDFQMYARPLSMFLSDVDMEKYPNATQTKRFELVETINRVQESRVTKTVKPIPVVKRTETRDPEVRSTGAWPSAVPSGESHSLKDGELPKTEQEAVMYFLDTDTYAEKWNALSVIREFISNHMIDTLAAALDIVIPEGDLEDRFSQLRSCISAFKRFETKR